MAAKTDDLLGKLGDSVMRLEDPPLITGKGRFAADINFPDQLHMRVVRSPYAHGIIKSVDTAAALAMPGIVAVWTSADVEDIPPGWYAVRRCKSWEANPTAVWSFSMD